MIELVVFLAGAVIMALEILGTRVLNPAFGSGLYVWAALLTVTLVSLAAGYFLGGLAADRWPSRRALFAIPLLAAALLLVLVVASPAVLGALEALELRLGALAGAFTLFGLPLILLGMVTPFSVRLRAREIVRLGQVAGRLYALGTVGSVAGTLATAFVLVPHVGHRTALLGIAALLGALGAAGMALAGRPGRGVAAAALLGAGALALGLAGPRPTAIPGVLYDSEGLLGRITVLERTYDDGYRERFFLVDGACQTHLPVDPEDGVDCEYIRLFDRIARWRPAAEHAYLIGLAGGAIVRLLGARDFTFDAADIDRRSLPVARDLFQAFDGDRLRFFLEDGRRQLRRMDRRYDAIVIDMLTIDALPFHLYSREAFAEARDRLRPGGILALNSSLTFDRAGEFSSASLYRTLRTVFPHVRCYRAHTDRESRTENRVFFASLEPLEPDPPEDPVAPRRVHFGGAEGMVFTDAFNPYDVLLSSTSDTFRRMFRRAFPEVTRLR
ncbi:MAG: fused MFS/spermidine synthase [Planctomycetes bacterium]|nr:fused MFS/spermidine synthase [Planctomycetota bacterium]